MTYEADPAWLAAKAETESPRLPNESAMQALLRRSAAHYAMYRIEVAAEATSP